MQKSIQLSDISIKVIRKNVKNALSPVAKAAQKI